MIPLLLALALDPFLISAVAGATSTLEIPVIGEVRVSSPLTIVSSTQETITVRIHKQATPGVHEAYLYFLEEPTNDHVRVGRGVRVDVEVLAVTTRTQEIVKKQPYWYVALITTPLVIAALVYAKKRF
ncbi:MAG: hypothetical protein ACMXYD_05400 [Candidatus Woesearchaeota archaeon]